MNQNSYKLLSQQKETNLYNSFSYNYLYIALKWILSLLIWGNFISFIILQIKNKKSSSLIPITVMSFSYILYFIFEFCTPTLMLLCSKTNKTLKEVLFDFKEAAPEINFICHDEIYNGHKINTFRFPYIFCMDISKTDLIYDKKEKNNRKKILKLKINREIYSFSNDSETFKVFNQKRNKFFQKMKNGKSWVDISFSGLKNTYLINIENEENKSLFSNCLIYFIFLFLSLGEIYELILKSITVEKTITISKIITVKNEIIIPACIENNNESKINRETEQNDNNAGQTEITVNTHNNLKLNLTNNNKKDEQGSETNRKTERISLKNSLIRKKKYQYH